MDTSYTLTQAQQVLNLKSNECSDQKLIGGLYFFYSRALKDLTSPVFQDSLFQSFQFSKDRISMDKALSELKNNDADSFLLVDTAVVGHCVCAAIRKVNDGFSVTLVNTERTNSYFKFTEFIFKKDKVNNLKKCLNLTSTSRIVKARLYDFWPRPYLTELVESFLKFSDQSFILNMDASPQKKGNCFFKQPEKAIKFAFATRNFSSSDFEKLRIRKEEDLKEITFKPKWDPSTKHIHRLYVDELKKEDPVNRIALESIHHKYMQNKNRKFIMETKDSILKVFDGIMNKDNKEQDNKEQDNQSEENKRLDLAISRYQEAAITFEELYLKNQNFFKKISAGSDKALLKKNYHGPINFERR